MEELSIKTDESQDVVVLNVGEAEDVIETSINEVEDVIETIVNEVEDVIAISVSEIEEISMEDAREVVVTGEGSDTVVNYEKVINKPKINNVELIGNKSLKDLGIKQEYTANDIKFDDGDTFQQKFDNGELKGVDGKDGADGKDGYTPVKNVDYFDGKDGADGKDGYTPVKNVDYFDGKDGADGKDGYTPVKGTDYYTETDKQEMVDLVQEELLEKDIVQDSEYVHTDNNFTNEDKNKLNNATTIEDMTTYIEEHKEELKGKDGEDGYTPVKGVDYYTEADKQEMVQLVLDEIPSSEGVSY